MKEVYKGGAVANAPPSSGSASEGYPTEGDVAAGTPATTIGAYEFYQLFRELEAVIVDGFDGDGNAMVPDKDTLTQVRDSLRSRYLAKADAGGAGVGGVADGKTATYQVVDDDDGKILHVDATGAARTVMLPSVDADDDGFTVTVIKRDSSANRVTIDGDVVDTINGAATYALKDQYESVILKWTGTEWLAIGGATSGWIRSFFGAASSRSWTAAGNYNYQWEWGTERGIAIIDGGGGGGGGGAFSGSVTGGDGGDHGEPGERSGGGTSDLGGAGGSGGADSSVTVDGTTHTAEGGGGGGGGRGDPFPNLATGYTGDGGDGGGTIGMRGIRDTTTSSTTKSFSVGGSGGAENGGAGGAAGRTNAGDARNAMTGGAAGGAGERKIVMLSGMSPGDAVVIAVGAGGAGGAKGSQAGVHTNGAAGAAGRVRLIPLF